jgi:acetate kinase
MDKKYLIVNTGSASKKYAFYYGNKKVYVANFEFENGEPIVTEFFENEKSKKIISKDEYIKAVSVIFNSLIEKKIIESKKDIDCASVRIVAPGEYFLKNKLIDKEYLKMAKIALEKVPLHLGPALEEIKYIKNFFGKYKTIYGISDSAFHCTIPETERLYAIPIKDTRKLGLYQYGYHGISIQSVIYRAKKILGKLPKRVIVCHLGGGASVTAVLLGKSIDTSMGFTPLDGLIMATRIGNIDPGAVLYLSEKLKKNNKNMETYFNNECGLLGLSGKSCDLRDLIQYEKEGHIDSSLSLKVYVNTVKKYIGRMAAMLGGVDLIILAGTVGERSFIVRERICNGLNFLGVEIDKKINNKSFNIETKINKVNSKCKILIVKTDETEEMAKETISLLSQKNK